MGVLSEKQLGRRIGNPYSVFRVRKQKVATVSTTDCKSDYGEKKF